MNYLQGLKAIENANRILKRNDTPEFNKYRLRRKQEQLIVKNKLKKVSIIYSGNGKPFVKIKTKKRTSFTEELRNKKGYSNYLNLLKSI